MKRRRTIITLLALFAMTVTGCKPKPPTSETLSKDPIESSETSIVVTPKTFTVTWVNHDDEVLEIDKNVEEGTTPTYDGAAPTHAPDENGVYRFQGWDPKVVAVTKDAVYKALFYKVLHSYTITWKNDDGTVLEVSDVVHGELPEYIGKTPTKNPTDVNLYTFDGWTPEIVPATADAEYVAKYIASERLYTVLWLIDENPKNPPLEIDRVKFNTMPRYDGPMPERAPTAQYLYTFLGWYKPLEPVTSDQVYIAQFKGRTRAYDVIWKNFDGTVLETDTNVTYGTMPTYDGATPTRPSTTSAKFTFTGWSPLVSSVTGPATYVAQYSESPMEYMVRWVDPVEGYYYEVDENVPYGTVPTYDGLLPHSYDEYDMYRFTGWTPAVDRIQGDTDFEATFELITPENVFYYIKGATEVSITGIKVNDVATLIIPDLIEGLPVKNINSLAFKDNKIIRKVIMRESVLIIGDSAFEGCTNLEEIRLNSAVTTIGINAFRGTGVLTMSFPSSVTSIGKGVLMECLKLDSVGLGFSMNNIPVSFAENSPKLLEIFLPNTITRINAFAFSGCTALRRAEVPGVTELGRQAFAGCVSLKGINLPAIVNINLEVFLNASTFETVTFGPNLELISDKAFYGTMLNGITLGAKVNIIGISAFEGCPLGLGIILGSGPMTIKTNAFKDVTYSGDVYIGANVTVIEANAFIGSSISRFLCAAASKPAGWAADWNSGYTVVYNHTTGI